MGKELAEAEGEFEIKFWKDWLEADLLERGDLVKNLPVFEMCFRMEDSDFWRESLNTLISGYFEDLESSIYTKIRLDSEKD